MVVGLSLVLEGQPAVRDVVQILEPLEVGHSHTTGVDVHVWDDQATVLSQNVVTSGSDGAVSRLGNDLSLRSEKKEKIVNTTGRALRWLIFEKS